MWPAPIINFFFYSFSANRVPLYPPIPTFLPSSFSLCHLHFFSFVSSTSSMKRFVHRAHLYSSCTNRSSTHCTLLWRAINSRLTLGDRWARHPCYFLQDFHDRLPAACTEHMYPLTVFCLSLLGIRESTGVNRFHTTVHLWDSVCIHTFTWVYSFNEYTVQLFG